MKKAIIFDASTLISLTMNGLLEEFKELKNNFKGEFIITKEVKYEVVDRPLKIKRFELEALKIKNLIDDGYLILPKKLDVKDEEVTKLTKKYMEVANSMFLGNGKKINLIHDGESSCLALSKILDSKKIENILAIDERTLRMLIEKPQNLKKLLARRTHARIEIKEIHFKEFVGFKIIRSTELMYVAYKKNLIRWKNKDVLDALLYALKFKGCAISFDEIEKIKKM